MRRRLLPRGKLFFGEQGLQLCKPMGRHDMILCNWVFVGLTWSLNKMFLALSLLINHHHPNARSISTKLSICKKDSYPTPGLYWNIEQISRYSHPNPILPKCSFVDCKLIVRGVGMDIEGRGIACWEEQRTARKKSLVCAYLVSQIMRCVLSLEGEVGLDELGRDQKESTEAWGGDK